MASQPAVATVEKGFDMKRGSVGLADVVNSSINIDVMATVRTHGDEN